MSSMDVPSARDIEQRIYIRIGGDLVPITDLTPASPTRQLIRAMIVDEYASLWRGLTEAQRDWLLLTGRGHALRRRLADFPIGNLPTAQPAYGQVEITVSAAVDVTAGTIVRTDAQDGSAPKRYQVKLNFQPDAGWGDLTDGSGSWHVATARNVDVVAIEAGTGSNTSAATITVAENPIPNLTTLTNPAPIANGIDAPSDAALLDYFRAWLLSLKGSTRGAALFTVGNFVDASTGRRVHSAALQEWNGITELVGAGGRLLNAVLYIDEGLGATSTGDPTADGSLVSAVQRLLDGSDTQADPGVRDAGLPAEVRAAQALVLDFIVALDIAAGYSPNSVIQQVKDAIDLFVAAIPVAGSTITGELQGQLELARLFRAIVDVPGVLRATVSLPLADVNVPTGYKAVVGALTVTGNLVS